VLTSQQAHLINAESANLVNQQETHFWVE